MTIVGVKGLIKGLSFLWVYIKVDWSVAASVVWLYVSFCVVDKSIASLWIWR